LSGTAARDHLPGMFCVSETEAAAIRTAYEQGGELSAAIELRRLFRSITDNTKARECARTIAGWTPLPVPEVSMPTRCRLFAGGSGRTEASVELPGQTHGNGPRRQGLVQHLGNAGGA
jgi:hypothetical protein